MSLDIRVLMSACIFSVPLCLGRVVNISSRQASFSSLETAARYLFSAFRKSAERLAGITYI